MRRPADQAKLLFLALLRSSAALATRSSVANTGSTATSAAAAAAEGTKLAAVSASHAAAHHQGTAAETSYGASSLPLLDGHIALRVARRSDVPSIQQCNLATLPENYSATFYHNHMRQWPDLALVAEHVPAGCTKYTGPGSRLPSRRSPAAAAASPSSESFGIRGITKGRYDPRERLDAIDSDANGAERDDGRRIVGYVLGKVEHNANIHRSSSRSSIISSFPPSTVLDDDDERGLVEAMSASLRRPQTENLGHVTSLAVIHDFRRKGLAAELMEQLHYHMRHGYRADAVGLHVRVSNGAATRLYRDGMGYDVHDIIQNYYQDGEDAYFMRKAFASESSSFSAESNTSDRRVRRRSIGSFHFRSRRPFWEVGPEQFRLPRLVANLEQGARLTDTSSVAPTVDEEEEELSDVEEEQVMSGAV